MKRSISLSLHFLFALLLLSSARGPLARASQDSTDGNRRAIQAYFAENAIEIETIDDFAPLFEAIGDRRFVLLGESTHGTREYYRWRDLLSRRLIEEKGFRFVGVEGDWQSIYRFNEYVKHRTDEGTTSRSIMADMTRWPTWMWANEEFADFLEWLKAHNGKRPESERVGVFGLDMQDPEDSMAAVLDWFGEFDAENYPGVKRAYSPVSSLPDGFRSYARGLAQGQKRLTEEMALPVGLLRARTESRGAREVEKHLWAAKQNALAVKRAEANYHAMLRRSPDSWNLRARHMQEAFLRIAERHGRDSRGIVWAHNTHVGDARATDMAARGEVNIGQLLRESEGRDRVFILGFATYGGRVIAASGWGRPMETMEIVPARPRSVEAMLREIGLERALIFMADAANRDSLSRALDHRAIGVLYRPPHEAYVPTVLPLRYDALMYLDRTRPLTPVGKR